MSSAQAFKVCFKGDAAVESSLSEWAAKKFVHSHLKNDQNGHITLFCKYDQARTATTFKLMTENFARHCGKIGTLNELRLLAQDEFAAATMKDPETTESPRPMVPDSTGESPIVLASLPADFDRLARQKYEKLVSVGVC